MGAGFFFGAGVLILVAVFVLDISTDPAAPGGRATRLLARTWPLAVTLAFGMGAWITAVWSAGSLVIDEQGVTNPYSFWRGRRIPWHEVRQVRMSRSSATIGTVVFEMVEGRPKILRLGLFAEPGSIIADIEGLCPKPIEYL